MHICGRSTDEYCARETACADDDGNNDLLKEIYQIQPGLGRKRKSARSEDNFFVETVNCSRPLFTIPPAQALIRPQKSVYIVLYFILIISPLSRLHTISRETGERITV